MNLGKLLIMSLAALALGGCETALNPSLTPEERAVLAFNVNGVTIDGRPGQLAIFPQVQHIPIKLGGYDVYEVYNATPNISEIKAWYFDDKLRRIELRYFNGPGVNTLTRAGGWDGIRDYLMKKYGPPSSFGSDVPILATKGVWNVKYAKFNGQWIFSRIHRQINYSAMADSGKGIAVITVQDTTPILMPKQEIQPVQPQAARAAQPQVQQQVSRAPNPGF